MSICYHSSADISGEVLFLGNSAAIGGALDFESYAHGTLHGRVGLVGNFGVYISDLVGEIIGLSPLLPSTGGAVNVLSASLTCDSDVSFLGNSADMGGAVFASSYADFVAAGSVRFRGNTAVSGGALYLETSALLLKGAVMVEGNTALNGGGIVAR